MSSGPGSPPAPIVLNTTIQRPPSICMKPLPPSAVSSPGATSPPITLTSKEWIVPPRPKPGRKPATDTPPTKRKAQNRAAQRAFRERRAARVGELEEQMKEIEDMNEQEQDSLRATVADLEKSLETCQAELSSWMDKCTELEKQLSKAQQDLPKQDAGQSRATEGQEATSPEAIGCGNCTLDTHCQCIDDVVQGMNGEVDSPHHIDSSVEPANKRIKLETGNTDAMEIDFTAVFSKSTTSTTNKAHTSAHVADPCGFCQDGTPCICAEMAAEQERLTSTRPNSPAPNTRRGPRQMAQFTPPPSEGDVASSIASVVPNRCVSGPGTCAQCVSDPNSTLFCKSLAASRAANGESAGCCGSKGAGGGCCQTSIPLPPRNTRSQAAGNANARLPPPIVRNPVTITCADAFTALSRHRAYEEASGDMASWMPKLHANPVGSEGRPAMEIDAANVMAVLKDFDRRFVANK